MIAPAIARAMRIEWQAGMPLYLAVLKSKELFLEIEKIEGTRLATHLPETTPQVLPTNIFQNDERATA